MAKKNKPFKNLHKFIIAMIILVLLAVLLPFFLKGPDEQALITPDKIKLPEFEVIKKKPRDDRQIPTPRGAKASKNKNVLYKWKDKHGVTHFTDYPNPNGPSQKIAAVPPQTPSQKTKTSPKDITDSTNPETEGISKIPFPMTISPSQVKKLKQDAEKIRDVLQQRYQDMSQTQEK
jgi:hypothetical protein